MPLLWLGAGTLGALWFTQGDDQSGLPWSTVLKVAAIAGAVYLAAKALKA